MTTDASSTHEPTAAQGVGVRTDDHGDNYFGFSRPELRALVPEGARRVLDVGCGGGTLGAALKQDHPGMEVVGLEGFASAAEAARRVLDRVELVNLDAMTEVPSELGAFDAIIFGDVLEHLLDPERVLAMMRAVLAPQGVLIMSIPNLNHWSVLAPLLLTDRWTYTDAGLLDQSHVHLFTLDEVGDMMERLALEVTHLSFTNHAPLPGHLTALADAFMRYTDEPYEMRQRLGAYQYVVVATPAEGEPRETISAGRGTRRVDDGLAALVPDGYRVIDLAPDGVRGVLDDTVRARMAAAAEGAPRAFVADGVMGHIRQPEQVLAELADAMGDDDVAVFSVANVGCWHTSMSLLTGDRWTYGGDGALAAHPIRFITRTELELLFQGAGLAVDEWVDVTSPLPAEHQHITRSGRLYDIPDEVVRAIVERDLMRVRVRRAPAGDA